MSGQQSQNTRTATISVLVDNESGVLARVIGLFSGRGYNIDSLTVAPVEAEGAHSRINVVTSGTPMLQSTLAGARTSYAQRTPFCQPLLTSCCAAEASASGTECQMSLRPSPSKSTPC